MPVIISGCFSNTNNTCPCCVMCCQHICVVLSAMFLCFFLYSSFLPLLFCFVALASESASWGGVIRPSKCEYLTCRHCMPNVGCGFENAPSQHCFPLVWSRGRLQSAPCLLIDQRDFYQLECACFCFTAWPLCHMFPGIWRLKLYSCSFVPGLQQLRQKTPKKH